MLRKNVKIVVNPLLLVSGVFYVVFSICICILMIILLQYDTISAEEDKIGCQVIFGIFGAGMLAAGLACMPRWLVTITLTDTSIEYRAAFKKATTKEYRNYPYVYRAWYKHRGILPIGYNANYIVLSARRLSIYEIQHINQIGISDSVIKIRYRRKAYSILCDILPEKQQNQLKRCFSKE